MRQLNNILENITVLDIKGSLDVTVSSITFDSRAVNEGCLFVAVKGTTVDGHKFIEQAVGKGASAILCEEFPLTLLPDVTYVKVEDSHAALGWLGAAFYEHPSSRLKLIGVTGTNGKTTCATLLFNLFRGLGYKCGLISTVQNQIEDRVIPATHTTPDAIALNGLLADMVNEGCDYTFMEVSSHALAQKRIEGLVFVGGMFTNITHDHLDFHKTFDEYLKAKKSFFDHLPAAAFALSNVDDKRGMVMLQNTKAKKKTYSLKSMADYKAKLIEDHFTGMLLNIDGQEVWFKMVGKFNAYNLLAVYAAATLLDQDKQEVLSVLSTLNGAEGRFDYIVAPDKRIGIVDYAHTPDAVQNVLETILEIRRPTEKIITVIGCGGDRDRTKRPVMAKVACEYSDKVILTSDNPRTEDPQFIIKEMEAGIPVSKKTSTVSITDRREAIKTACMLAQPGDIILLAGKGHEKYQDINGVKHHFDDKEELLTQFGN
ncbi:UDP-N-acetylmuramoyl-L-alanyl-D-glutamate--2,6-diaminopimelate ligase [Solitalea canadensis]|uniref:UDP-N-acetylmuramoyl-L-alanyl-D-glutamate--2,6-diaminopimelate ligase n=1 Tax=Solitalea canadensis (strain ATCC 29591 / DSM 3403 / JCM 21819 / LMG 8368 / NBRC 15130 / NCIMB 12057 / USAM 9D) TaxID=929556 RepID=H8KRY6_SOLCM|nr:UDP-N-acetylmuramoyl-L-alanyl-D-glutamate--2,6-diaminopimelate ligase [Solitalea canadensis]AFD07774.1 UDP-N-acetylmuramyl-tripeptide synthetase [Solitalea canadensis DSM 3403]